MPANPLNIIIRSSAMISTVLLVDASTHAAFAPSDILVNSKTARTMLGNTSHATLHCWQHGLHRRTRNKIIPPLADFPAPVMISGRRYWRRSDLERFINSRARLERTADLHRPRTLYVQLANIEASRLRTNGFLLFTVAVAS
jgi:hypothetical protein